MIASGVGATGIRGVSDFRESARPIYRDVLAVRNFMDNGQNCVVLLKEKGATLHGPQMWIPDLIFRTSMTAVLRNTPVLDFYHGLIDYRGPHLTTKRVCIVLDSYELDDGLVQSSTVHPILFRNRHWVVIDGGMSLNKLLDVDEHEYFAWIRIAD